MYPLSQNAVIAPNGNATATGQTTITGNVIDMAGFDAITLICSVGGITNGANVEVQLQGSPNANGAGNSTEGTTGAVAVANGGNQTIILDVIRPANRYVYPNIVRTTQNAIINQVTTIQYRGHSDPAAVNANVACQTLVIVN